MGDYHPRNVLTSSLGTTSTRATVIDDNELMSPLTSSFSRDQSLLGDFEQISSISLSRPASAPSLHNSWESTPWPGKQALRNSGSTLRSSGSSLRGPCGTLKGSWDTQSFHSSWDGWNNRPSNGTWDNEDWHDTQLQRCSGKAPPGSRAQHQSNSRHGTNMHGYSVPNPSDTPELRAQVVIDVDHDASYPMEPMSAWNSSPSRFSAEHMCLAAREKLATETRRVAAKLGAADPCVESIRLQMRQLKRRSDELRWKKVVSWHRVNVATALDAVRGGADVEHLEAAVRMAHDSEIGPGHDIVLQGKRQITLWRKHRMREWLADLEVREAERLSEAEHCALEGNERELEALAEAISESVKHIGSAHPLVEHARHTLKHKRLELQRRSWTSFVRSHELAMRAALASNDPQRILECAYATTCSELGPEHPFTLRGKERVRRMRVQAQLAEVDGWRQHCLDALAEPDIQEALAAVDAEEMTLQWP